MVNWLFLLFIFVSIFSTILLYFWIAYLYGLEFMHDRHASVRQSLNWSYIAVAECRSDRFIQQFVHVIRTYTTIKAVERVNFFCWVLSLSWNL